MKTLIMVLALAASGCGATFADVPAAVEPVLDGGLPLAGETLQSLSDAFKAICKKPYDAPCEAARKVLNDAIDVYTKTNNLVPQ